MGWKIQPLSCQIFFKKKEAEKPPRGRKRREVEEIPDSHLGRLRPLVIASMLAGNPGVKNAGSGTH